MASESGSIGTSNFLPNVIAADWYVVSTLDIFWSLPEGKDLYKDLYMPHFFNMDSAALEDVSRSQDTYEPPLSSPSPTGDILPTFFSEMLLGTPSVQAVEPNVLPSPPAFPRTGVELWIAGGDYSSVGAPIIPPVRLHNAYPQNFPHLEQQSRPRLSPWLQLSRLTGSRYHRGAMIMDASNGISSRWSPFLSARAVVRV